MRGRWRTSGCCRPRALGQRAIRTVVMATAHVAACTCAAATYTTQPLRERLPRLTARHVARACRLDMQSSTRTIVLRAPVTSAIEQGTDRCRPLTCHSRLEPSCAWEKPCAWDEPVCDSPTPSRDVANVSSTDLRARRDEHGALSAAKASFPSVWGV